MLQDEFAIIIADDSEADRFFLKHAIRNGAPRFKVVSELETGEEAIAYLAGEGRFSDRQRFPKPDLLFLDLRMPCKGGLEVLEWLQSRPDIGVKVAVLADTSGANSEPKARSLGAHYFFSKIAHGQVLTDVVRKLQSDLEQPPGATGDASAG